MKLQLACLMSVFAVIVQSQITIRSGFNTQLKISGTKDTQVIWIGEESGPQIKKVLLKTLNSEVENNTLDCLRDGCELEAGKPIFLKGLPPIGDSFTLIGEKSVDFSKSGLKLKLFFDYEKTGTAFAFVNVVYAEEVPSNYIEVFTEFSKGDTSNKFMLTMKPLNEISEEEGYTDLKFKPSKETMDYFTKNKSIPGMISSPTKEDMEKNKYDAFSCTHVATNQHPQDGINTKSPLGIIIRGDESSTVKNFSSFGDTKEIDAANNPSYERRKYLKLPSTVFNFVCHDKEFSISTARII